MSVRMIHAKIKAGKTAELEKDMFTAIEAAQPQGVRYASCKFPDGVTITSNDEYASLVEGCALDFRPLPGTGGTFDVPRWVQSSGGPASVIRLVAEYIRTVHKAVLAVARQDAPTSWL